MTQHISSLSFFFFRLIVFEYRYASTSVGRAVGWELGLSSSGQDSPTDRRPSEMCSYMALTERCL